jgi:acetyl-CoA acyltransferase 1
VLALEYNISRSQQDAYGLLSHRRASEAQREGRFKAEIMPIQVTPTLEHGAPRGHAMPIIVTMDDGIRHGLTVEQMSQARPAFIGMGDERSTGPNSSQVTDGAAMVFLMRRRTADDLGLEVLAKHIATTVVGVSPRVMGIGPTKAIPYVESMHPSPELTPIVHF